MYTTFSKGQNYGDGKEISGCQKLSGVAELGNVCKGSFFRVTEQFYVLIVV